MILKTFSLILHSCFSATLCSQPAESVPGIEIINLLLLLLLLSLLYQTVQQCLSSEMHLVQRSEGVGADNNVNTHWSCIKYMILFNVNISAWSWCFECDGQWHDLPDSAAAQRTQKVNSRMWNRNRENTTNARTPLNKFLQASSDIRYVGRNAHFMFKCVSRVYLFSQHVFY